MNDIVKLSELVSTRLTHDIAGQIGAIFNSIELMEESPEMMDQFVELLSFSSKELMARIKFFRLAYGLSSENTETDLWQLKEIAETFLENKKVRLNWDLQENISQYLGKIILLLISSVAESLIKGGEIKISNIKNTSNEGISVQKTIIEASGEIVKFDTNLMDALLGNAKINDIDSKNLPCYMIFLLAHKIGQNIDLKINDTKIQITVG